MSDLKAWREAHENMSQTTFADLAGTTQPHISAIENGDMSVSLELAAKIFRLTRIQVGKLQNATPEQCETIVGFAEACQ